MQIHAAAAEQYSNWRSEYRKGSCDQQVQQLPQDIFKKRGLLVTWQCNKRLRHRHIRRSDAAHGVGVGAMEGVGGHLLIPSG